MLLYFIFMPMTPLIKFLPNFVKYFLKYSLICQLLFNLAHWGISNQEKTLIISQYSITKNASVSQIHFSLRNDHTLEIGERTPSQPFKHHKSLYRIFFKTENFTKTSRITPSPLLFTHAYFLVIFIKLRRFLW